MVTRTMRSYIEKCDVDEGCEGYNVLNDDHGGNGDDDNDNDDVDEVDGGGGGGGD